MKKLFSLILTVVLALNCFCLIGTASAQSFETENGVKIEMAPFLYKSALYQMEYPSHQSYEIKEKSVEGDYAISREINDLSYTFVFPAGTTSIECNVSLNGENGWTGFRVNSTDNQVYWEKDADGNVDYSKPLTFYRDEATAERDEYGVLYRDFLKDAGVKGFRDYNKIYWQLIYTCNGEVFTEYFDIKLYEYDSAEKYDIKIVNFNVAGLPFGVLSGRGITATLSPLISSTTVMSVDPSRIL